MPHYVLLTDDTCSGLREKVNAHLKQGYQLHGETIIKHLSGSPGAALCVAGQFPEYPNFKKASKAEYAARKELKRIRALYESASLPT